MPTASRSPFSEDERVTEQNFGESLKYSFDIVLTDTGRRFSSPEIEEQNEGAEILVPNRTITPVGG
jgi:hypothetical protein